MARILIDSSFFNHLRDGLMVLVNVYHDSGWLRYRVILILQFKPEEITGIMKDFDEPGHLAPTGLHLGGTKYMVIQGEPGAVIRGKKVM